MNTDPITAFAAAFQRIQEQVQRIEELEARLAGLSHSTVTRYVAGQRDASTENMVAICDALDIEARYLPGQGWALGEK